MISQWYFPSSCWTLIDPFMDPFMDPKMDPMRLILGESAKKRPSRVPPRSILALKCVLEPSIGGCVSKKTQIYRLAYTESQYTVVFETEKKLISKFLRKIKPNK